MSHDYTQQPEFLGPATAATYDSTGLRFPEELGPACEIPGRDYGSPGYPVIGPIPPLMPPEMRDRERAECERRNLLRTQVGAAALAAARDVLIARQITDQVLADTAAAVERAVAEPAGEAS